MQTFKAFLEARGVVLREVFRYISLTLFLENIQQPRHMCVCVIRRTRNVVNKRVVYFYNTRCDIIFFLVQKPNSSCCSPSPSQ